MDKWMQQLHFVIRANTYLTGELAVRALKTHQVYYAIIAKDTSLDHQSSLIERLQYYHIPYRIALTKIEMSTLTQRKQVVMIAVTNRQLAESLKVKETTYEKT